MAEPANRQTNPAGGKYYIHPLTNERFDSVTTILDIVDKAALKIWSGMVAADHAFEHLPQLLQAVMVPACGNSFNKCYLKHGRDGRCERCPCGKCEKCWWRRVAWRHEAESNRRAQEGTEFHEAVNAWVLQGGAVISLRKAVQPYFDSFTQWVTDFGLQPNNTGLGPGSWEQTEITLLNRDHMYGGTSDGAVWIRAGQTPAADLLLSRLGGIPEALVRVDYKTREKPDERLYYDMPLQGVAYERALVAMLPNGEEYNAPRTHARAILQLRPADYSFKLMLSDDDVFGAFLGILTAYRWMNGPGKKPFDEDTHFPGVVFARAIETAQTVLDAEVIEPDIDMADPAGVDFAAVQEAVYDDPWGDPVQAYLSDAATEVPLPELPDLTPPKETGKRPSRSAAGRQADPFAAHNNPNQAWVDANRGSVTLGSMSSKFSAGKPQLDLLDEQVPF